MQYIDSCLYDLVSHVNIMPHIMVHLHKSTLVYLPTYIVLSAVIIHRTHTIYIHAHTRSCVYARVKRAHDCTSIYVNVTTHTLTQNAHLFQCVAYKLVPGDRRIRCVEPVPPFPPFPSPYTRRLYLHVDLLYPPVR